VLFRSLKDLFSKIKSENWTPENLLNKIDAYLKDLPNRPGFTYKRNYKEHKKGDPKTSEIEKETLKMMQLRSAIQLFPQFQKRMKAAQRYDFDDMILWVLRAFENNRALLLSYQEQYLYFLVDEFQDTNGSQNEILKKLISYWENPNLFIVGDDDQSIYEFQGARLKNLTEYIQKYRKDISLIVLRDNYRSSQNILDLSHELVNYNKIRITNQLKDIGIDKHLAAQHPSFAHIQTMPTICKYQYQFHEIAGVVAQIEQMKQEGFPLNEIAVIYAKHHQSTDLIEFLKKKNIPFNIRRKINLLELKIITQIRGILQYLQSEINSPYSGENLLYKILYLPFWSIDVDNLARIAIFFAKNKRIKEYTWRDTITNPALLNQIGINDPEAILNAGTILKILIEAVTSLSLPHLIEQIFNRTGLVRWAAQHPERAWYIQVLYSFLDFVKSESSRNPHLNLSRLIEILQNMDRNKVSLELQKIAQTEEGVNLLTAHGSKGLEFQRVFIIDCTKKDWEPSTKGARYRFSLPDTITYSASEDEMEAQRRLFFVAMTRAKEQLIISYSSQSNDDKTLTQAVFIDELVQSGKIEVSEKALAQEQILEAQLILLSQNLKPKISSPNSAEIQEILSDFRLSASALTSYLSCPLSFFYQNILKLPSLHREAAIYGTAIHKSLEKLYVKMLSSKTKKFPSRKEFIADFEQEMNHASGFFSSQTFERYLKRGKTQLPTFYEKHLKNRPKTVKLEYKITNAEVEGVPVVGVIDKVEFLPNQKINLVDYKTGKYDAKHFKEASQKNPEGGKYWLQLLFYKLLFENYKNIDYEVISMEIAYTEPDKTGVFHNPKLTPSSKEVEDVRQLIKDTYQKIMNQEFYEGCNESYCTWCNFVKNQITPATFSQEVTESLDDLL
ncbi:MAG TPA: ATP-dependent helicase, partial [Saprospiraceae bacterium]|nr:ATP-dependent helicase [Saprospiraceae bacterium]